MTFYQLALRYLRRKKSKTIILLLILLFVNSMILSTSMVLRATDDAKSSIQEKTNSKILLEITDENNKITEKEMEQISKSDEVTFVNRMAVRAAFPSDFLPFTRSDSTQEDNQTVSLLSYDDLEKDSVFSEGIYRLITGSSITAEITNGAVINSYLADYNGLEIGDTMDFETAAGRKASVKIIGLFTSGSATEEKQMDTASSIKRIENQIFVDNTTYSELFENDGFNKAAVYIKRPELLESLEADYERIFADKAELTTSDTLYKQTMVPLEQIGRAAKLMLMLTFVTGIVVVTLLLSMWMRTRKKETAIFISMGKLKIEIFLQIFLESLLVFTVSVLGACGLGSLIAQFLQSLLSDPEASEVLLTVFLQFKDVVSLVGLGGLAVLIAVTCSLIPTVKANPKDTLSRME